MKKFFYLSGLLVFIFSSILFAQNKNLQIGSGFNQLKRLNGGFYDYSDPTAINIKVSVWGFVRYPGKYIIPSYSSINDLLSYAGGPTDAARLQEMRLYRTNSDSTQTIIPLDYKDIMFNTDVKKLKKQPSLKGGDILLVLGKPRLYFRNYISIALSVVSTLISLAILILNISRK